MSRHLNRNLFRNPQDPDYDDSFDTSRAEEDIDEASIERAEYRRENSD